jgi:pyruvate dehydrogenase E1 component alpha subunit
MTTRSTRLELYRRLLLARLAEERIRREYASDEMKTPVHLGIGGEAIAIGVCEAAPAGAPMFGTYRNHALYLALTDDTDGFFGELYGRETGCGRGKAGSMHLSSPSHGLIATSAVVGTTIPVAVGAALAQQYRGESTPVIVFFGDGAIEEGAFWESLNFACLRRLRVLFVCEDNGLAIHTATPARQGFRSIVDVARQFECQVAEADGADLDAVVSTTLDLFDAMDREARPALARFTYFRALEHVGPAEDFGAGYRPRPSEPQLRELDPVARFEDRLRADGVTQADLDAVRRALEARLDASVDAARHAPFPGADELHRDLWA